MELSTPNYGIYFDLDGIITYNSEEFNTIKKIINNILSSRYYQLEVTILFNEEIATYDGMKKQLSNNIMQVIGHIPDELIDDIIDEIKNILAIEKVIRHRSSNSYNNTGYSDDELLAMYNDYIEEALKLEVIECNYNFGILNKKFEYANFIQIKEAEYLDFIMLLLNNGENLDSFEMLYDFNVINALFKNFPYFIKYLDLIDFNDLIIYYKHDLYKILRNIRLYVKQISDDYNDNIKELFLYQYILNNKFSNAGSIYDPEEGLNKLLEIFDDEIFYRESELIHTFEDKVKLFKNNYNIIAVGDSETKAFKQSRKVADIIKRNVAIFDQMLDAFRKAENTTVRFNSKFNNTDEYSSFLELLKKARLVKEYTEKYSLFTITLENEAVSFVQGKWFEYYTSSVCEDIIQNYIKQGHNPDYGIYQNVVVELDGFRRELDIIVCINDLVYYIENKIERRNTLKSDLDKYRENSEFMNIDPKNCYLVYLNGEDNALDDLRVCSIQTFTTHFKKGVLHNLDHHRQISNIKKIEEQKELKLKEKRNKSIQREKARLYNLRYDPVIEERRINKAVQEYNINPSDYNINVKDHFFIETQTEVDGFWDEELKQAFKVFRKKYENEYLKKIKSNAPNISFYQKMLNDLIDFDQDRLKQARSKLYCLTNKDDELINMKHNPKVLLMILCGYGTKLTGYYNVISTLFDNTILFTNEKLDKLFVYYLNSIDEDKIVKNISGIGFDTSIAIYLDFVKVVTESGKVHLKNPKLKLDEEYKFINVLIYTFLNRHYDGFNTKGLSMKSTGSFIAKLMYNLQIRNTNVVQEPLFIEFNKFQCKKLSQISLKYYDVASYIYLNYHFFADILANLSVNIEEGFIFELPKSDQLLKLLKLLSECEFIKDYKEVKNTDVVVGIFDHEDVYSWFVNYHWVSVYLSINNNADMTYGDVEFNIDEFYFRTYMVKEVNGKYLIVLGHVIDGDEPLAKVVLLSIDEIEEEFKSLNNNSFTIKTNEIQSEIDRMIGKL